MIRNSSRLFGDQFSGFGCKVKNLVALAPVIAAILRPEKGRGGGEVVHTCTYMYIRLH